MNQQLSTGIVLKRTDYGEADRIVTFLTPEHGKLSLMARGVRKPKSKLAGGIELFSVSELSFIKGRGDLGTLVSIRLQTYYSHIVKQIERVQLGYECIKILNRTTEDAAESEYFDLLQQSFIALDDLGVATSIIDIWFKHQLLKLAGHSVNLRSDTSGKALQALTQYAFDVDVMAFNETQTGKYGADHIKLLRLIYSGASPKLLQQVTKVSELTDQLTQITQAMLMSNIRI